MKINKIMPTLAVSAFLIGCGKESGEPVKKEVSTDSVVTIDPEEQKQFILAVQDGKVDVVLEMLDANKDLVHLKTQHTSTTPLWLAAQGGYLEIVKILIANGANANQQPAYEDDTTPLQVAAQRGDLKVVQYLLDKGADAKVHYPYTNGSILTDLEDYRDKNTGDKRERFEKITKVLQAKGAK